MGRRAALSCAWRSASRVSGSRAVYERFAGYVPRADGTTAFVAGPRRAYVDRVVWHTIPDAATAAAALQRGEADWWEQPSGDLLPPLRADANLLVQAKDPGGSMSMIRFNTLQPPFDNPATRRAFLPAIRQSDYMTSVMGEDHRLWNGKCGFFLPGGPLSTEDGRSVMDGAPDHAKVKANLQAAGYKGEKVVFVVPSDLASLNAFSAVAADMFRRVGINLDYQASDWGPVAARLANKGPPDQGGWSVWCNNIPGIIAVAP
ncbi:MAG: ABC transporter substrate-binding protein, partial [Janthinobacterium lividum]